MGCNEMNGYTFNRGIFIAIIGVDGSGKTTIINTLLKNLNSNSNLNVVTKHLRPGILPPLSSFSLNKKGDSELVGSVMPHSSKPSGTFGSLFRILYLTLDYIFGYWFYIFPGILLKNKIFIFDRYAYDLEVDPYRFRIKLNKFVIKIFSATIPKPDLVLCLIGDGKVICERKKELSYEETARQINLMTKLSLLNKNFVTINVDKKVDDSVQEALHVLYNFLHERQR